MGRKKDAEPLDYGAQAEESDRVMAELARSDINAFCEFVLRDERTNQGIGKQPSFLVKLHTLCDKYDHLVVLAPIEHAKSSSVTVARTLFNLGKDPSLRCAIISNTKDLAGKSLRAISDYIERSAELKLVFPYLRKSPRKVEPWSGRALTIERPTYARDPSVQALGVHGNVEGSRLDFVIYDDPLDPENTATQKQLQDTYDWHHDVIEGRLTERARIIILTCAWHPSDMAHRLARQPGWHGVRFPAVNSKTGKPLWPERWSIERLHQKRIMLGPLNSARKLDLVPRSDEDALFKQADIDKCRLRGERIQAVPNLVQEEIPVGAKTVTGVDLAAKKSRRANKTVLFTALVHPNGDRQVLWIESGKWGAVEIKRRIVMAHERFGSFVFVEDVAAQAHIIQILEGETAIPVRPIITGRGKNDPSLNLEHLAGEFYNGKWIIPQVTGSVSQEFDSFISDLLLYKPGDHMGDTLSACLICQRGIKQMHLRSVPEVGIRVIGTTDRDTDEGDGDASDEEDDDTIYTPRGSGSLRLV